MFQNLIFLFPLSLSLFSYWIHPYFVQGRLQVAMAELQKKVDDLKGEWEISKAQEDRKATLIAVGGFPPAAKKPGCMFPPAARELTPLPRTSLRPSMTSGMN